MTNARHREHGMGFVQGMHVDALGDVSFLSLLLLCSFTLVSEVPRILRTSEIYVKMKPCVPADTFIQSIPEFNQHGRQQLPGACSRAAKGDKGKSAHFHWERARRVVLQRA
jgi:hypothetical protein